MISWSTVFGGPSRSSISQLSGWQKGTIWSWGCSKKVITLITWLKAFKVHKSLCGIALAECFNMVCELVARSPIELAGIAEDLNYNQQTSEPRQFTWWPWVYLLHILIGWGLYGLIPGIWFVKRKSRRWVFQCGWMEMWFWTPNIYQEGFREKELNWCPLLSFRTSRPIISPIGFLFQQTKQFLADYCLRHV